MRHFAFLHGGGQGSWVWQQTVDAMRQQSSGDVGKILLLDAPGCGTKRDRDTQALSLDDVADELILDIEQSGLQDVVLVGHSQGGQAMSLMVARRPDLFARLVHLSCSVPLPGQTVSQMLGRGLHGEHAKEVGWPLSPDTSTMEARYRLMFCNDMSETEADRFLAKLGKDMWPMASYAFDAWDYAAHSQVPATFVLCLQDLSLPLAWQEVFAERFAADHRVSLDAGHQAMVTRPQALAEILRLLPA